MSENKVLSRIFGPKRNEAIKSWRKLHAEELIGMITSRRMRKAGHVA
jgi:hypothetical protein